VKVCMAGKYRGILQVGRIQVRWWCGDLQWCVEIQCSVCVQVCAVWQAAAGAGSVWQGAVLGAAGQCGVQAGSGVSQEEGAGAVCTVCGGRQWRVCGVQWYLNRGH